MEDSIYKNLFDWLHNRGITCVNSEMDEVINICEQMIKDRSYYNLSAGFYIVQFKNKVVAAERVIEVDGGNNYWLMTGSNETVYDNEVIVIESLLQDEFVCVSCKHRLPVSYEGDIKNHCVMCDVLPTEIKATPEQLANIIKEFMDIVSNDKMMENEPLRYIMMNDLTHIVNESKILK